MEERQESYSLLQDEEQVDQGHQSKDMGKSEQDVSDADDVLESSGSGIKCLEETIKANPLNLLSDVLPGKLNFYSRNKPYLSDAADALETITKRLEPNSDREEEENNNNNAAAINETTKQLIANIAALFNDMGSLINKKNESTLKAICNAVCFLGEYYGTEYNEFFLHHAAQYAPDADTFKVLYDLDVFNDFKMVETKGEGDDTTYTLKEIKTDNEAKNLLHRAAMNRHPGVLKHLIDECSNAEESINHDNLKSLVGDKRDKGGFSVLDHAAKNSLEHFKEALLSDAPLFIAEQNNEIKAPLFHAAGACPDVVHYYLEANKKNPGAITRDINEYLTQAMKSGQVEIVDMLIDFEKGTALNFSHAYGPDLAALIDIDFESSKGKKSLEDTINNLIIKFNNGDENTSDKYTLAEKLLWDLYNVLKEEKQTLPLESKKLFKPAMVKKNVRVQKAVLALHTLHDNLDALEDEVKNSNIGEKAARLQAAMHVASFLEKSKDFTEPTQKAAKVLGAVLIGLVVGLLAGVLIAAAATGNVAGLGGAFAAATWMHHIILGGIAGAAVGATAAGVFTGHKLFESNRAVNKFHDLMESTYVDEVLMPIVPVVEA